MNLDVRISKLIRYKTLVITYLERCIIGLPVVFFIRFKRNHINLRLKLRVI